MAEKSDGRLIVDLSEGWLFPSGVYTLIRLGQIISYWGLQIYYITRWYQANKNRDKYWLKTWLQWFILLALGQFILAITGILLVSELHTIVNHNWLSTTIAVMALLSTITFFLRPHILYGWIQPIHSSSIHQERIEKIDPKLADSESQRTSQGPVNEELHELLSAFMQQKKPFLIIGYALPDLSTDTGLTVHMLSNYINRRYNVNYNEYINHFRIEYFKKRLQEDDASRMTLEALAMESGFSNRFTFTSAFKRSTGTTPSQYFKTIKAAS